MSFVPSSLAEMMQEISARMARLAWGIPTALCLLNPALSIAQLPPERATRSLTAADGLEVRLFASEPLISNPIALDVDSRGRVWVTEGVNYRRNVANPPNNKIKVLEDTDGDGVADKVTVFASDLNAAMGICVAGTRVYVPESPHLYVYEDRDGDLKADGPRKQLLTGFGGKNHDHGTHGQVFGPDHKLYMTQGDTGYNVTGPDGKRVAYRWGAMIRCEGDGTQLEDFAVNFRNPFELAIDSFGNVWCSDNDNDGLKSARICWILEGGNYGWSGAPEMIRDPDGSFNPIHHWRADKPGYVPHALITGFGSPCGMTFYEGSAFGPLFTNKILHCDAGPREVRCYSPRRQPGTGYSIEAENILTSTDNFFRPDDVCVAPDGAIFVNDWYDGGVGGHAYNDPTRGRIYRVTPRGKALSRKEKPGPYTRDEDALVALGSPNAATTFLARERLLASGVRAIPLLEKLVAGDAPLLKARALWLLDRIGGKGREVVRTQLKSTDPAFRALAVRILRRHGAAVEGDLLAMADDQDGEVLKEVLLGVGALKSAASTATLVKLFHRYDGHDRYYLESLHIASRGRESEVFKAVFDGTPIPVDERLISMARILKPEDAIRYICGKMAEGGLSEAVHKSIIAALSSMDHPEACKCVAGVVTQATTVEIKRLALEALRMHLGNSWSLHKNDPSVQASVAAALADPTLAVDALSIIGDAGLAQFDPAIVAILADERSTSPVQLAALGVASRFLIDGARPHVTKLLEARDPSVRDAALRGLVAFREIRTLGNLLTDATADAALKERLADLLMQTSDGAVFLLRLVDTKRLERSLGERVITAAIDHPDVNVRLLYKKYIPASQLPKTLGQEFQPDDILKLAGDSARGEHIFFRSGAANCTKCHRVKGKGADTGPDLSQIGRKFERRALLDAIINPSAGMAPEYVPYVVETESGKVYAGFLQQQTEQEVVLRSIDGSRIPIPRENIAEIVKQSVSLMPELALKNVTAQDAADLLAYLSSLQTSEVHAMSYSVVGPFANEKSQERPVDVGPEQNPAIIDLKQTYRGLGGKQVGWTTANPQIWGMGVPAIDVRQVATVLHAPSEQVTYYFAATLESATEQAGTLHVGSDSGILLWVNGAKVHEVKETRPLKPGQDQVAVNLKAGRNVVLLKLAQGSGPGGFTLSAEARGNLSFDAP